jgi:cyclohexa-1,5-dienecarbonyl-CoA hydratase
MPYDTITVTPRFDGQVTEVALGPPPANIVTGALMEELLAEIVRHGEPGCAGVKAVVIAGQGDHFSYGASVAEHRVEQIRYVLPRFHRLIQALLECPVPTIARVRGRCLGGGFELAMACSIVFADAEAEFALPEIKLGVIPPVASVLLPFIASQSAASEIVLSGETFSAADMNWFGVVGRVAEGDLGEAVDEFVEKNFLAKSASSLRFAGRAVMGPLAAHYRAHIPAAERMYLEELMASADANEGIEAFLEKRKPTWRNA